MRQTHAAGERLFVYYVGDGVPVVIDRLTGEIRMAQIFVAVLGASSFTFAKATWTQALPDWINAHVRAFEAIARRRRSRASLDRWFVLRVDRGGLPFRYIGKHRRPAQGCPGDPAKLEACSAPRLSTMLRT